MYSDKHCILDSRHSGQLSGSPSRELGTAGGWDDASALLASSGALVLRSAMTTALTSSVAMLELPVDDVDVDAAPSMELSCFDCKVNGVFLVHELLLVPDDLAQVADCATGKRALSHLGHNIRSPCDHLTLRLLMI